MTMKNKLTIIMALALMAAILALTKSDREKKQLQDDIDRQEQNVSALTYTFQYDRIDDSTLVVKHEALQAKYYELEKLRLADTKLIKQLRTKLKDTEAIHTMARTTADTIYLSASAAADSDSVYTYADKWIDLKVDIPQRQCQYSIRDSLTTIVSRTYKHRFLWWRWGTKGYEVQIVNHNPHTRVNYSKWVKVLE